MRSCPLQRSPEPSLDWYLNPSISVIGCTAVWMRSKTIEMKKMQTNLENWEHGWSGNFVAFLFLAFLILRIDVCINDFRNYRRGFRIMLYNRLSNSGKQHLLVPSGDIINTGGRRCSLLDPHFHVSDLLLQVFSCSSCVNSLTSLLGHPTRFWGGSRSVLRGGFWGGLRSVE